MNDRDLIMSQIRQRLEILYQMVEELETSGGSGDAYTKAQTDSLLALKADKSSTYTKTEVNTALANKANTTDVNEIFAIDSISISEGQSLSADLTDWLRLHKPLNLNGVEFYFSEESGVDYIYKAIEPDGALPKFSVAQILKGNLRVQFYETTIDLTPTEDSINLITSDAVYDVKDTADTANALAVDNRAALVNLVDEGAKNALNHTAYTRTVNGVDYTVNADRSIGITSDGTNTQSLLYLIQNYTGLPAGKYVLSGCTGGSSTTYDIRVKVGNTTYINYDDGTEFTYNGTDNVESSIVVRAGQTLNITMKPMICLKDEWDISKKYQPYRPTYQELYEMVLALQPTT